jgi:hypothetical protein
MMREEEFWLEHPEHRDFYEFWDAFHFSTECHGDGDWYDFDCIDFGEDEDCRIEVHWNDCDASQFECSVRSPNDMGNGEDCALEFRETAFWNNVKDVPVLQDPQYESFIAFWSAFHEGRDCVWNCELTDCAEAFGLDHCEENSCFNSCDNHWNCRVEYVWEDQEGDASCIEFYNYTAGNNTNPECLDRDVYAQCTDFAFVRAMMEEDGDTSNCDIFMSYNPCVTGGFICEISEANDYGVMEMENCAEDFEDGEFWAMMRVEDFWLERELYDFYNFWERFHGNADEDEHDCDWKEFNTRCTDFEFIRREMEEDGAPEGADCDVFISFSPCETDYFVCTSTSPSEETGEMESDDCTEDFTEIEFWSQMRVEQWWMEHPDAYDFYMFWDEYHFGSDNDDYTDEDCEDRSASGICEDFMMFGDSQCTWTLEYNSCPYL